MEIQNAPKGCIILDQVATWPEPLINFFEKKLDLLKRKATASYLDSYRIASEYDMMISELRPILNNYSLLGFHCTRLTRDEQERIKNNGMSLTGVKLLKARLETLLETHGIEKELADLALSASYADDKHRKDMLWFCFFEPWKAGESGIREFFEYWGGESLYRPFENQPQIKAKFKSIGLPCIVVATLPIRDLKKYVELGFVSVYERYSGISQEPVDFEGYLLKELEPENIEAIIEYPDEKFDKLTGSENWNLKNL